MALFMLITSAATARIPPMLLPIITILAFSSKQYILYSLPSTAQLWGMFSAGVPLSLLTWKTRSGRRRPPMMLPAGFLVACLPASPVRRFHTPSPFGAVALAAS